MWCCLLLHRFRSVHPGHEDGIGRHCSEGLRPCTNITDMCGLPHHCLLSRSAATTSNLSAIHPCIASNHKQLLKSKPRHHKHWHCCSSAYSLTACAATSRCHSAASLRYAVTSMAPNLWRTYARMEAVAFQQPGFTSSPCNHTIQIQPVHAGNIQRHTQSAVRYIILGRQSSDKKSVVVCCQSSE